MQIRSHFIFPPIPSRDFDWAASLDTYDGAPDSGTRHQVGYGRTEAAAIVALMSILADDA